MTTTTKIQTSFEDFAEILFLLKENQLEALLNSPYPGVFDLIKLTSSLLKTLADFYGDYPIEATLSLFKEISMKIIQIRIKPIIAKLKKKDLLILEKLLESPRETAEDLEKHEEMLPQILAKWWQNYFSILDETYRRKKEVWGDSIEEWISKEETGLLEESFHSLEQDLYWKIVLLRACCSKKKLLERFFDSFNFKFEENYETIRKYLISSLEKEVFALEMGINQSEKPNLNRIFREKLLKNIKKILETESQNTSEAILAGRIDKKTFGNLSHSVIIGEDGGFYVLLNEITQEEKDMLLEGRELTIDYSESWKLNPLTNTYKIYIGRGTFGIIRLSLALTHNETSNTLKAGQLICVKKTSYFQKNLKSGDVEMEEIRENAWNDYSVGELSKLIFSPAVYDMKIVEFIDDLHKEHQKGYTMQEFVPVYDGSKVFGENKRYFNNWIHQKSYLVTFFEIISKLLNKGICMVDIKPDNTLYDGENYRAMLIDLAGVVHKPKKEDLMNCQFRFIKQFTKNYSAPELNALDDEEDTVDLLKCMSYSLGVIIREIVLNYAFQKDYYEDLKRLSENLRRVDPNKRFSVEEGLEILKKIGIKSETEKKIDFSSFVKLLVKKTEDNFERFGLNPKLKSIGNNYIKLNISIVDPDKYDSIVLEDLSSEIEVFLHENSERDRVFILLGSSGSGKSTFLQRKYLEEINNWEKNDPMPFYINLAVEEDLKSRWKWICQELDVKDLNFNIFSGGLVRYPMNLFIDSFDEVASKINFVEKFMGELGFNQRNKCLICCRSEFIQKEQDFLKYFQPNDENVGLIKRYIVPLNKSSFDYEIYIEKYYKNSVHKSKIADIGKKIREKNLKGLMKTSYMVQLTLDAFPEIIDQEITRSIIYEKYIDSTIKKVAPGLKELLMKRFDLKSDEEFINFIKESGFFLAETLHRFNIYKLDSEKGQLFLNKYFYDSNIPCLENKFLVAIIRSLNLIFEIKGVIPKERITLRFMHDSIKNYFLTRLILRETLNGVYKTLSIRLFIEDEALMKFLAEIVKENFEFLQKLKEIVYFSREFHDDDQNIIASSNAISILTAANVSFAGENLSNIKINGASLRDGVFNGCDFTDADLTEVNLKSSKLNKTFFNKTKLKNVQLGIYPDVNVGSEIFSACFSLDGSMILCGCKDKTIKLWEISSGKLINMFEGHKDLVNSVCFSPDNLLVLSGSDDSSAKLWEKSSGKLMKTLTIDSGILSVCFSFDSMRILTGSKDNIVRLWGKAGWQLLKMFDSHSNWVTSVCFSHDGTRILSGSRDNKIKLWDRPKRKLLKTLKGHTNWVNSAAFSPDDALIVSGSQDQTIKIWDKITGNLIKTLEGHTDTINSVNFSPNGYMILSGSCDKSIKLWDKTTGNMIQSFEGHKDIVNSACFSNDGSSILSCSNDYCLKIWNISLDKIIKIYEGHHKSVNSVQFSPDDSLFVSSSSDTSIKLWDSFTGSLLKTFEGHKKEVNFVCFSPDSKKLISCSCDNMLILWETNTGSVLKTFEGHSQPVTCVTFSTDGNLILSCSRDSTLKLWSLNGQLLNTLEGHSSWVNSVVFSSEWGVAASASDDKTVILWQILSGQILKCFKEHTNAVNSVCFSRDGSLIASGSDDKTVNLWEKSTGNLIKIFEGHSSYVYCVNFSNNCELIVSTSADKIVKVWDVKSKRLLKNLKGHNNSVISACFSTNESMILSSSSDNSIKLWENKFGNLAKSLKNQISFSFSHKKSRLITISKENSIIIWDTTTKNPIKTLKGHIRIVTCFCFSPDDSEILSGSYDKTLKLWNANKGNLIKSFNGHLDAITSVCFSSDGNCILSGSSDKTIILWDRNFYTLLQTFQNFTSSINFVCFSPDDSMILSKSSDHSISIWEKTSGKLLKSYQNSDIFLINKKKFDYRGDLLSELGPFFLNEVKDFQCTMTLSSNETALICRGMTILEPELLHPMDEKIFIQRNAIKLKFLYLNESSIKKSIQPELTNKQEKTEKPCMCFLF